MTLDPHIIRLRGPWQLEPVHRYVRRADGGYDRTADNLPPATKATMPADWAKSFGADFLGRVRYARHFNVPTGLEPDEKVFLVVEPPRSAGRILLTGRPVGLVYSGQSTQRFDITGQLQSHNRLEIFVDHPAIDEEQSIVGDPTSLSPGGLVGEVRLEIVSG